MAGTNWSTSALCVRTCNALPRQNACIRAEAWHNQFMTTPQFTLRHLLALVTLCAIGCLILATGNSGRVWGVAIALAFAGAIVILLTHGILILAARLAIWILSRLRSRRRDVSRGAKLLT